MLGNRIGTLSKIYFFVFALKLREFFLEIRKNWQRTFGGSKAGAEAITPILDQPCSRLHRFSLLTHWDL